MPVSDSDLPRLLPGERLVSVEDFTLDTPTTRPSSLVELERLARAESSGQVGDYGPVKAAEASLAHQHISAYERYNVLFGRDSLRVALDLLDQYPKLAKATLLKLAELQGVQTDNGSEEEPGRIVHEVRNPRTDAIAQEYMRLRGWKWPYYGSVDATPEFIRLLVAYCKHAGGGVSFLSTSFTAKDGRTQTMAGALRAAVNWAISRLDSNKEGLLECLRRNRMGIENQVWKDSWDAYFHADGRLANHELGVASIEVQRVAFDALLDAAEIYELYLNEPKFAVELRQRAETLRNLIMDFFWVEEAGGYFALGSDRDEAGKLRLLKVRASNMGHLLHSRLLLGDDPEVIRRREMVISQLFSDKMLCLNGIRTLASDEVRFRPGAYHNGSCWGWDNYIIAQGLELNGYFGLADYLEQVFIDAIGSTKRYVEFFRGSNDPEYRLNTRIVDVWDENNQRMNRVEQPPQDMQAWTTSAVLAIQLSRGQRQYSRLAVNKQKSRFEQQILSSVPAHPFVVLAN